MRTPLVFMTVVLAGAIGVVARGDVPDGKGGRTSPQGLAQPKPPQVAMVMACCREPESQAYRDRATNPAERKAMGHLAWVDATTGPRPLRLCKTARTREARYGSPAELKALGHVTPESVGIEATVKVSGLSCCSGQDVRSCRIHTPQP